MDLFLRRGLPFFMGAGGEKINSKNYVAKEQQLEENTR